MPKWTIALSFHRNVALMMALELLALPPLILVIPSTPALNLLLIAASVWYPYVTGMVVSEIEPQTVQSRRLLSDQHSINGSSVSKKERTQVPSTYRGIQKINSGARSHRSNSYTASLATQA